MKSLRKSFKRIYGFFMVVGSGAFVGLMMGFGALCFNSSLLFQSSGQNLGFVAAAIHLFLPGLLGSIYGYKVWAKQNAIRKGQKNKKPPLLTT
jgi:hypothetical protein